jgi:acetyl/propionyl-CoA carboxylase alpha subunit
MIHGQDRTAVTEQVEQIVEQCGLQGMAHAILFSKRCFKQRGANYAGAAGPAERVVNE